MSLNPVTLTELDFGTTADFSISMWIRQDDFANDPAVLSNKNWANGGNTGVNWAVKGNGIFDLNTKGSTGTRLDLDTAQNSTSLGVGVWSHVLMTIDRDGPTKLYINGVNTGTINLSSPGTFNGSLPWNIGQDGTGNYSVELTGAVDELAELMPDVRDRGPKPVHGQLLPVGGIDRDHDRRLTLVLAHADVRDRDQP